MVKIRLNIFILTLILLLILVPCLSAANNSKSKNDKVKFYTKKINCPSLILIKLKENVSTGYTWEYKINNTDIAEVIYDEYVEQEHKGEKLGAGGLHIWYVLIKSEGETKITFKLSREWEKEIKKKVIYELVSFP